MTWYLVMASMYIGPFPEDNCKMAQQYLQGAICKQADYMQICPVPDHPELVQSCSHFTFPEITIK